MHSGCPLGRTVQCTWGELCRGPPGCIRVPPTPRGTLGLAQPACSPGLLINSHDRVISQVPAAHGCCPWPWHPCGNGVHWCAAGAQERPQCHRARGSASPGQGEGGVGGCWCGPAAPSSPRGAQGLCPAHGGLGCDVKILQPPAMLHFAELFLFNACYKPPVSPRGDSNQWHPVPPNPCGKEPLPLAWGHPSTTPHPPPSQQTQLPCSGQILSRGSSMAAEATPWEKVLAAGSRSRCCRRQPLALPR